MNITGLNQHGEDESLTIPPDTTNRRGNDNDSEDAVPTTSTSTTTNTATTTHVNSGGNGSANNNTSLSPPVTVLGTYLSLISQYLSMFCLDNAVWLAEQGVAAHPSSTEAVYMLALCYYRKNSPKAAKCTLDRYSHLWMSSSASSLSAASSAATGTSSTTAASSAAPMTSTFHNTTNLTPAFLAAQQQQQQPYKPQANMPFQQQQSSQSQSVVGAVEGAAMTSTLATTVAAMHYLAALCSFELEDYAAAEDALLKRARLQYKRYVATNNNNDNSNGNDAVLSMDDWILHTTPCPIPNGAAGLALLGKICRASHRKERATQYFEMSLLLDPFLWTSLEALSELGISTTPLSRFFGDPPACIITSTSTSTRSDAEGLQSANVFGNAFAAPAVAKTPLQTMETPIAAAASSSSATTIGVSHYNNFHPSSASSSSYLRPMQSLQRVHFETPGLTPISVVNASMMQQQQHNTSTVAETPARSNNNNNTNNSVMTVDLQTNLSINSSVMVLRRARDIAARQYYPPSPETPVHSLTKSLRYLRGLGESNTTSTTNAAAGATASLSNPAWSISQHKPTTTKSSTMNNSAAYPVNTSVVEGGIGAGRSLFASENVPSKAATQEPPAKPESTDGERANKEILELLYIAGMAYQHLCLYKCREALQDLKKLPAKHATTAWALCQAGRAHLELGEFPAAQRNLELMLARDPARMKGVELLSTVYWQLKKEVELASLAQRVVAFDRLSPEAWCVVGNCFSLQKDHETALVFFGRSLQLDPNFTYTHTLSGYEYMANEDFDKAMTCFRQALTTNDRHYNAWYGLGAIYHRQEKFDLAEYHFERAVQLHPTSAVLRCNLGICQYANGQAYKALDTLQEAFRLDPHNPQARFQRATIYSALHRPEEALQELLKVRDAAPREAAVHLALGKVYKRLGRTEQALKCFLTAMDLDPKDNQMIKSAMDKLHHEPTSSDPTQGGGTTSEEESMAVF